VTPVDLANDEVLLDLLTQVLDEADPVPVEAIAAAKVIAGLQGLEAELAALVADSVLDEEVVLFRHDVTMSRQGERSDRMASFATPQLEVDIELHGDGRSVIGALHPPVEVVVDLETADGTVTTTSDELGRFVLESGPGPCRLRIHAHGGAVVTPWITR
jgi:hypothetical protein